MIIDISCYPTDQVDLAWWHEGDHYTVDRLLQTNDPTLVVRREQHSGDAVFCRNCGGAYRLEAGHDDTTLSAVATKTARYVKAVMAMPELREWIEAAKAEPERPATKIAASMGFAVTSNFVPVAIQMYSH